ncbi:arginase family protein [Rhizobium laguerreae]|uniref:arginase family protein n=1 Tax=Rhizobium laguerreae TaxID=1076926 RepID=UPI001C902A5F|nr:arginase family protein [Rhizobium laguerreae]MBY3366794.1 arginase family protein [Rhizobium laguerreae]
MPTLPYAILEAPSTLGLATEGVEHLPDRLMDLGLAERIHAHRAERLAVPPKDPMPDPETGILNARAIAAWSPKLADAVEAVLDSGRFPVVLGGDCTILMGSMLAFRRRGRYGLFFIDGNADFFQPEAEPQAAREAVDHLTREELDGFFIHLDADCLDDVIMPAVDFRVPDGLSWDELETALRVALASGKAVGIEITIYNPRLDEDGSAGRGLADVLAAALGAAAQ